MWREITTAKDILENKITLNEKITVAGWVRTRRDSKAGFSFIALHDGSSLQPLQIVALNALANYEKEILHLSPGCSLLVRGILVASPAKGQVYEIMAEKITVFDLIDNPEIYPITPKYHTLEYLREFAHLRPRTNVIGSVTRISHTLAKAIHQFFDNRDFFWIRTPIITTNDCEGAGQQFRVTAIDPNAPPQKENGTVDFGEDFFGSETFLTVSGQLNLEAYCEALGKVYTFGPTFRAENSNTSRHLAEFWMLEPEIAFADLDDIAFVATELLKQLAETVLKERKQDLQFFDEHIDKETISRLKKIVTSEFVHMEYKEAITILQRSEKKFIFPIKWGMDLQSEHERFLTEEYVKAPIIAKNYPKEIKSFYMRLNNDDKTVAAMDILVPGMGEIIGGSQREERFDLLAQRIEGLGPKKKLYDWYLDLRRYGTVPHAGFGLGFERFIAYVTGLSNIRDTIPFPRTPKHAPF